MARVQTPDLSPPEPIRPAPLKGDTFVQAAPPPIDNSLAALERGLGAFRSGVEHWAAKNKAEMDEKLKEQRMAEYQRWRASTTNADQVQAIREGKLPYYADPFIGAAVRKDYGSMEARALAEEVEADLDPTRTDSPLPLHQPDFNIEKYLLEKAAPYVKRLGNSYEAIGSFRAGLDQLRQGLISRHQEARGLAAQQKIVDIAYNELGAAFDNSIMAGRTGADTMKDIRQLYEAHGPRMKGGTLDLQYGELDNILLGVLAKRAQDPRMARQVIEVLNADRIDVGNGYRLGSLAQTAKHAEAAQAITNAALKTLGKDYEIKAKGAAEAAAQASLLRVDGSFSTMQDAEIPNPFQPDSPIKVNANTLREEVVKKTIVELRAANGGQTDFEKEFALIVNNGIKHPEWIPKMEAAVTGFLNSNLSTKDGPNPDQIKGIAEMGQLFDTIADGNHGYLRTHLSAKTREFYETYTALRRSGGMDPTSAAAAVAKLYSTEASDQDPSFSAKLRADIETKVGALDTNGWWPGGSSPSNKWELNLEIQNLARLYARTGGVGLDEAVKMASDRVKENSIYVNGRALFGAVGIEKGDEKHFSAILSDYYEKNKEKFDAVGIDSASKLSVAEFRNGKFLVVSAETGMPVSILVDQPAAKGSARAAQEEDGSYDFRVGTISRQDILRKRQEVRAKAASEVVDGILKRWTGETPDDLRAKTPWAQRGKRFSIGDQ